MIKLEKGEEPEILRRNAVAWTQRLLQIMANGDEPTSYLLGRYADPQIKNALLAETNEKCAYCESPLRHIAYGDVEHITPKSTRPDMRFAWHNLTIACDVCNTNKADVTGLVDPYQDDPDAMFHFYGPLMWPDPGSAPALLTEAQLDLNRTRLVERRSERLEFVRNLVASAASKPADIRDAMLLKAAREVAAEKPYSACSRVALPRLREMFGI